MLRFEAVPEPAELSFGPFVLGPMIATRRQVELCQATLFGPDGAQHPVALRRTRALDDGPNEALLGRALRYALLRHPAIAEVKDLGTFQGRSYVATELVRGHNLLRVLARCGARRIGFPTDVALYIVRTLLTALEHAHGRTNKDGAPLPVIHGDLGHTNVLLTVEGEVRLTDFNLALGSTRKRTEAGTNQGLGKGFTSYLSPEQVRGEPLSPASDLFGIGILLYELVTGRVLFTGAREELLLEAVGQGAFEVPLERHRPDLHPALAAIIRQALAADPRARPGSAAEMIQAIDRLLALVRAQLGPSYLRNLMSRLFGGPEGGLEEAA